MNNTILFAIITGVFFAGLGSFPKTFPVLTSTNTSNSNPENSFPHYFYQKIIGV